MRQRTYGGVGSPAREGGLTRFYLDRFLLLWWIPVSKSTPRSITYFSRESLVTLFV